MAQFHRFEDALPAWRAQARRIAAAGPPAGGPGSRPHDPLAASCVSWLAGQGCWPNQAADMPRVEAEVQAALHQLFEPLPQRPPTGEIRGGAWAVPAAVGAGVGALLVAPLSLLLFDNRPIGLVIGGVLGAYLAVRALAALLERPALVAALRSAASLSGGGMIVGGMWRAIRGQAIGVFRSVLWLAIAPLLLTVVQSRMVAVRAGPPAADPARQQAELLQAADLALAVCWSHPDRLTPPAEPRRAEAPALLGAAVWGALSRLQGELARAGAGPDLRDACEELLQRLQEDGYAWRSVARGTAYAPEMTEAFETFGALAPGLPVRTLRGAITRHGQVVHKGEIRRA